MAEKKVAAKSGAKGGAQKGGAKGKMVSSLYDLSTGKRKNKSCPKCGAGVFLAEHKDRITCGKCGYMEKK